MAKEDKEKKAALVRGGQYQGKYVAFPASGSNKVIASGVSPGAVIRSARSKGVDSPSIVFVPKKDVAYFF